MPRKLFRRLFLFALVAAISVAGLRTPQSVRASSGPPVNDGSDAYITNEVNIELLQASDLPAIEQKFNLQLRDQFGSRSIYHLRITDGRDAKLKAADLVADARVKFAEANFTDRKSTRLNSS